jgi:hypothetical protein
MKRRLAAVGIRDMEALYRAYFLASVGSFLNGSRKCTTSTNLNCEMIGGHFADTKSKRKLRLQVSDYLFEFAE